MIGSAETIKNRMSCHWHCAKKNFNWFEEFTSVERRGDASSETLSWWCALWCENDWLDWLRHPKNRKSFRIWSSDSIESKGTHPLSVLEACTCHSTFPNVLLVFFCRMILTQNPAQANNFIFPAMASPRQVVFFNSRAHTLAGARACKWMVSTWGQS